MTAIVMLEVARQGPQGKLAPEDRVRFDRAAGVAEAIEARLDAAQTAAEASAASSEAAQNAASSAAATAAAEVHAALDDVAATARAAVSTAAADAAAGVRGDLGSIAAGVATSAKAVADDKIATQQAAAQAGEAAASAVRVAYTDLADPVPAFDGVLAAGADGQVWHRIDAKTGRHDLLLSDASYTEVSRKLGVEAGALEWPSSRSPSGEILLAGEDGSIRMVWDAITGTLRGPFGMTADTQGRALTYSATGFTGWLEAGKALVSGTRGTWAAPASNVVIGILGYGQSWMAYNIGATAMTALRTALFPDRVLAPADGKGPAGLSGSAWLNPAAMTAAFEQNTGVQSVVGPLALRHAATNHGTTVFVRSEARGGYTLAQLAPADMAWGDGATSDDAYGNALKAVDLMVASAQAQGCKVQIAAIPWCHGAADAGMDYATYRARFIELMERLQADVMARTGQTRRPQVLVVQPPGIASGNTCGNWPNLQAQVDVCEARADFTLAATGWAVPQGDGTHFTTEGAVLVGELLQLAAAAAIAGRPYSAPYIISDSVRREGAIITGSFGGDYTVREEAGIVSKRHYLSDLSAPVPFCGFEYIGGPAIQSVEILPRSFRITLSAAGAGRLAYAWHAAERKAGSDVTNESANRGTLIAREAIPLIYTSLPPVLGVASFYKDI